MNLNLKAFKKIDSNDKHTILQSEKGHMIKIAHGGLTKEFKKHLDDLPLHRAKGGMSGPSNKSKATPQAAYTPPKEAKNAYTEPDNQGASGMKDVVLAAMERKAPPFGPLGSPQYHSPPCINPSCKSFGRPHPNCRCYGGKMGMYGGYAEGGKVETFCSINRPHEESCEYYKPKMLSDGGSPVEDAPGEPLSYDQAQAENQQVPQEPQMPEASSPVESAQVAQPQQPTEEIAQVKKVTPQDVAGETTRALLTEAKNMGNDINNGHVQPKTYHDLFADKSLLGKVGSIFSVLVGGMGSGLTHQPNAALQMMDNEINRDLDAQKTNVQNKQNYIKLAGDQLSKMSEVTGMNLNNDLNRRNLAWSAASRAALHKFTDTVMKLPEGSPQRQQGLMALSIMAQGIDKKEADIFSQSGIAQAQAEMAGAGNAGAPNTTFMKSGMMGPAFQKLGEETEQKTLKNVPGIDPKELASRPIPEQKRQQIEDMGTLEKKANQLISYAKIHEGTWDPDTRGRAQQMAEELVSFYSNSLGTSMTEGTRHWLDEQIAKKNPTSVIAQALYGSQARLKEIRDSNNMRRTNVLNGLGFHPQETEPGNDTKFMYGHTYKKVDGGWKKIK